MKLVKENVPWEFFGWPYKDFIVMMTIQPNFEDIMFLRLVVCDMKKIHT